MAAGAREYSSDASGTKRVHPGWAGTCGITAAVLARGGMTGPRTAYEGRFGLYATHLRSDTVTPDLPAATREHGTVWETMQVAIKPFPVGQLNIAFIDAAITLATEHAIAPDEIASIEMLVPPHAVKVVCEPVEMRRHPPNIYGAQFGLQYQIACCLIHRKFGLAELERFREPQILALADKVNYRLDENTGYPQTWSGEIIVTLKNGQRLTRREQSNRGSSANPLPDRDIVRKFMANAQLAVSPDRAGEISDAILGLDDHAGVQKLADSLSPPA